MKNLIKNNFIPTLLVVILLSSCNFSSEEGVSYTQEEDSLYVVSNYDKREVMIEMRDGTQLFTSIYEPVDTDEQYPIIIYRTPYSCRPYGTEKSNYKLDLGPNSLFIRDKYIFVYQDVRGAYMSEGEFNNMTPHNATNESGQKINESTDTFDTIEWLISNTNNNGKVGQWGISYPGFYTAAGIIDNHPALVAASPQAPIADWFFDDFHHHGAFFLPHTFNFFASFGVPRQGPTTQRNPRFDHGTEDGYSFFKEMTPLYKANENYLQGNIPFWNDVIAHPNYDEFWQERNILPHLNNINCAVLTVGGWFDAEDLYGPLNIYQTIETNNPSANNAIIMGPWGHGGWRRTDGDVMGDIHFKEKTSDFFNNEVIYPFFRHHLKGADQPELAEAIMFETGTNQWRTFDEWPPSNTEMRNLYFKNKKGLSFIPPKDNEYGADIFRSNPDNPVPFYEFETTGMPKPYMTADQRFVSDRRDVLTYVTTALEEDVTLAGPIEAVLKVSTNQGDADWVVKLIDVYPESHQPYPHQPNKPMKHYQQLVRSEVLRGRFRDSYENPKPFVANESTEVRVPLQDVLHTFKKGHQIMIQVQSSWFPMVDMNPQKYVDNIFEATEEDFVEAKHRVFRAGPNASYIRVGILENQGS